MEKVYYEVNQPGSYGGIRPLIRYSGSSANSVKNWLQSQDAYTLHRPVRKIFPRRKTFSKGINDVFQADLADMQNLARYNDNFRYLLTCICVFSKFAFAIPVKDKRGTSIAAAFEKIFSQRSPNFLQSDRGSEFLNREVQEVFRKYSIKHYWSYNDDLKASCVERFNRTIKTKIFRYLTHHNTNRWIDVIEAFVQSYNNSHHRTIGMSPNQVNSDNQSELAKRMYPPKPELVWKFKLGDRVRISRYKHIFQKGYLPNWTEEIFTIAKRFPTFPVTYGLIDLTGDDINGKFYEQELQLITKSDDVYIVEKILKTRKRNGKLEYFVKWRGYPDKFNSWTTDVYKL
jgi:transposase InsO family protein